MPGAQDTFTVSKEASATTRPGVQVSCGICRASFSHPALLEEHEKTRHSKCDFGCGGCRRQFLCSRDLRKHSRSTLHPISVRFCFPSDQAFKTAALATSEATMPAGGVQYVGGKSEPLVRACEAEIEVGTVVQVMADFEADLRTGYLPLKRDDAVQVTFVGSDNSEAGWLFGALLEAGSGSRKGGWFPASKVRRIAEYSQKVLDKEMCEMWSGCSQQCAIDRRDDAPTLLTGRSRELPRHLQDKELYHKCEVPLKRPLIVNIASAHQRSARFCSLPAEENIKSLEAALSHLCCPRDLCHTFKDHGKDDLEVAIENMLCALTKGAVDGVLVHVSGHGCQSGFYCDDEEFFSFEDLQGKFENSSKVSKLPKIYFYDLCFHDKDKRTKPLVHSMQFFAARSGQPGFSSQSGALFPSIISHVESNGRVNLDDVRSELDSRMRQQGMVLSSVKTKSGTLVLCPSHTEELTLRSQEMVSRVLQESQKLGTSVFEQAD